MVHAETVFYGVDHPKKAYYIKGLGLVLGGVLRHPPRRSKVKGQGTKIGENDCSIEQSETRGIIRELSAIEQSETRSLAGHEVTCSSEQRGRKLSAPIVFDFTFFKKSKALGRACGARTIA